MAMTNMNKPSVDMINNENKNGADKAVGRGWLGSILSMPDMFLAP